MGRSGYWNLVTSIRKERRVKEVARRQRASRKAEWGEYAHHSGAAERENMLVVVLLAAVHLAYNQLV